MGWIFSYYCASEGSCRRQVLSEYRKARQKTAFCRQRQIKGGIIMGNIALGILIPFAGTTLGSACVYFMKNGIRENVEKALLGFASGVMVAASVWSLLIPSMNLSAGMGRLAFIPAVVGFLVGMAFLLFLDRHVPHLHIGCDEPEGPSSTLKKTTMLVLAVTLHNIPEGMAVGVMFAGMLTENSGITMAGAFALSIGIAIQNFPEGAIISLPLRGEGMGKTRAFIRGSLSGAVEPVAAVITVLLYQVIAPILPYLLAFAAGAMMYVVVEELIPETAEGEHSNIGTIGFAVGFALMMMLDVALG